MRITILLTTHSITPPTMAPHGIRYHRRSRVSQSPGLPVSPSAPSPNSDSMTEFEKKLDPNIPPFLKQIALDRHRSVLEGSAGESSQRDSFRAWDTQSVPDGTYILRVSASDLASNPTDPMTTFAVSTSIIVCNSAPTIHVLGKPQVRPDRSVFVRGVATQALASITAVQYRVDNGDWISATADDGIFDSSRETFQFSTVPLSHGKHSIEILAFNSATEQNSIKLEFVTP